MSGRIKPVIPSPLLVTLLAVIALALPGLLQAQTETYELPNGMQVIMKPQPGSPMIASLVFIESGSKYESLYENGITHFLEHLLFKGTAHLTRDELDNSITDLGGYINAFTRKDLTCYLVLVPRQFIDYAMTVQADMLFNSTFPEDELSKERKVVIEEIRGGLDRPGATAEVFFTHHAYAGTDYNRPVLGYEAFIENIPRQAIIDYWKRFYVPSRMTLLVIGDFTPTAMRPVIDSLWGSIPAPEQAAAVTEPKIRANDLAGLQRIVDTVANVRLTHIDFSIAAPHFTDADYFPVDLLVRYLNNREASPLAQALIGGDSPLASEFYVALNTMAEFSRIDMSIRTSNPNNVDSIMATVRGQLAQLHTHMANSDVLRGIKTSVKCDDIYSSEKLHYYGFIISGKMMATGYDFIEHYPENLATVTWSQCQQAAREWLRDPRFVATVVRPADSTDTPFRPEGLPADEVRAYFDTAQFVEYELSTGIPFEYPSTEIIDLELADSARYHREVLHNGLTVIVKSSPGSQVFAMNVLGKYRTANEPEGKAGITDFVNRCMEKGTVTRSAEELARDLGQIGAQVTLYDNPWIPYDDRYTTRVFSFCKFETIDEFAERGFHLFCEMLLHPAFEPQQIEQVRQQMQMVLGRQAASPSDAARDGYYQTLFAQTPYARPIMGDMRSVASITREDLIQHHRHFYSPENMIVSIVTQRPIEEVMTLVNDRFGRLAAVGFRSEAVLRPEPFFEPKKHFVPMESEQSAIYLGNLIPGATSDEATAMGVAVSILSERLYKSLRERQGLAYSVGAGARFDREFGWYYAVMSTGTANFEAALDGILLQIDRLRLEGASREELDRARNSMWGRLMSAKLSRINQAYYLAVDEMLGRSLDHDHRYLRKLAGLTLEDIRRVSMRHLKTDAYVLSGAGVNTE
jgi:zinc protease